MRASHSRAVLSLLAVASRVLDVMPGHTKALHTKGLALGQLSQIDAEDYKVVRAAALTRQDEQIQEGCDVMEDVLLSYKGSPP